VRATALSCAGLLATWLALIGVHDPLEVGIGVGAAVAAAVVAATIRVRAGFPRLSRRARSWSRVRAPLARIPADLGRLAARHDLSGAVRTATLPRGTNWREHGERGLVGLIASLAPNAIVLDVSADGKATYHQLVGTAGRLLT
jgi:hypothetical protein